MASPLARRAKAVEETCARQTPSGMSKAPGIACRVHRARVTANVKAAALRLLFSCTPCRSGCVGVAHRPRMKPTTLGEVIIVDRISPHSVPTHLCPQGPGRPDRIWWAAAGATILGFEFASLSAVIQSRGASPTSLRLVVRRTGAAPEASARAPPSSMTER
jgi:hypothetical protein